MIQAMQTPRQTPRPSRRSPGGPSPGVSRSRRAPAWALVLGACLASGCGEAGDPHTAPDEVAPGGGSQTAGSGASPRPLPAQPLARLELPEDRHGFGRVWEGAVVTHEFALVAAGEADLAILRASADCGCTVPSLEVLGADGERRPYTWNDPVPPGTRLVLRVEFDTRGRVGFQEKAIQVFANVEGGVETVHLSADVAKFLQVEPKTVALGELSVVDSATAELLVSSLDGTRFALRHTGDGVPPAVKVHLEPVLPDAAGRASTWEVRGTFGPGLPKGLRSWPLDLETDIENPTAAFREGNAGPRLPHGVAPMVHAVVLGKVSALPPQLSFGILRGSEVVAKTVTLTSHDPSFPLPEPRVELAPVREGAPLPLADTASLTVRPVEGENAWTIELLLDGLSPEVQRSFLARLVIQTGHPEEPRLEVNISGMKQVGS